MLNMLNDVGAVGNFLDFKLDSNAAVKRKNHILGGGKSHSFTWLGILKVHFFDNYTLSQP